MERIDQDAPPGKQVGHLFESPALSHERLPGLTAVFDRFQRSFAEELTPFCRAKPSLTLHSQRTVGLFDLLGERHGSIAAIVRSDAIDAKILLIFERSSIAALTHAAFGGARDCAAQTKANESRKPITEIEKRLLKLVAASATSAIDRGFSEIISVALDFEKLQVIDDVQLLGRRDADVIAVDWTLEAAGAEGSMTIVLTSPFLLPMRQKLLIDPATVAPAMDQSWALNLKVGVESTRVNVSAVLEEIDSTLAEVAAFKVGRVLDLKGLGTGRLMLACAGRDLFWCKLDQADGRHSLIVQEQAAHRYSSLSAQT